MKMFETTTIAKLTVVLVGATWPAFSSPVPAPGFDAVLFSTPSNQLPYQINTIGPFTAAGDLLAISRDEVGPLADHNVLAIEPSGTDSILVTTAGYPAAGTNLDGRFGNRMVLDGLAPASFALIADAGTIIPTGHTNSRVFSVDLASGAVTTVVTRGQFLDIVGLASPPGSDLIYIADRGDVGVLHDGRVATFDRSTSTFTDLFDDVDPGDLLLLEDGSLLFIDYSTNPGLYRAHDDGLGWEWNEVFDTPAGRIARSPGTGFFGNNVLLLSEGAVTELVDTDGDFVFDVANPVVTSGAGGGIAFDASGTLYVGSPGPDPSDDAIYKITPTGAVAAGRTSSLTLNRAGGGDLLLDWDPSCTFTGDDYEIYEGMMGDYTSHTAVLCSTSFATSVTLTPDTGSRYYLIVPRNSSGIEGSYGLGDAGAERSRGLSACAPQILGTCPM